MTKKFVAEEVKPTAMYLLNACVSDEYSEQLWGVLGNDIIDDVWGHSGIQDGEMFSDSDVRYAIGRVLCDRFGVEG